MRRPRSLSDILAAIEPDPEDMDRVSVADVLAEIGERSFAALILVVSVLLVSPLSGIPGTPTLGAMLIVLIGGQWLLGRRHLWLPGVLLRRGVSARKLARAVAWLKPSAAWLDRHSHGRIKLLTRPPLTLVSKLLIVLVALTWPVLELLPMVTSVGALAVSLLAFGMMMRDGVWLAAGYATVGACVALVIWLAGQV